MILGVLAVLAAAVLLLVAVGHDARADNDAVVGVGTSLVLLVAAVAVLVLFTTGVGLVGITWMLALAGVS
jgi:hypothetical protein